jgi:glyoxylase-like metal-dependent hydrolase (beta-lactamase superfamily II)
VSPADGLRSRWAEVGRDVYVLRYPVLDVSVTLVVGDDAALLVDTLSTDAQAAELTEAAAAVTPHPWTIVNTHHHFDHCFGNAVLDRGRSVWAHEEAAALLAERADALQRRWYEEWLPTEPELANGLARVRVRPPDRRVHREATLDIGGRAVVLRHLGRGHTAGDLVVQVPDAEVLVAGDLVEESGPPDFTDAYPLEWPETVAALRQLTDAGTAVVPGHGAVVDQAFIAAQHDMLAALAWLIRDGHADGAPAEAVAERAPLDAPTALTAVRRGYAELSGIPFAR